MSWRRRELVATAAALSAAGAWPVLRPAAAQAGRKKVLRYAFPVGETGFDPAQINDIYSRTVTPHIFEALYEYDHLARPSKFRPLTADGMPQPSDDFRTWTVKIRPGIFFADDPAFKGRPRELAAQDYVYTLQRFADPKNKSPAWTFYAQYGFFGLAEARQVALDAKQPFDYDRPLDGLRALDRYTVQFRMPDPRPRFIEMLAASDLLGAVAREVAEAYADDTMAHPVGTGPFKLVQWRRSSFIALERNPTYRERFYDAEPAADDVEGQALLARFKGRRLPMIDRVEISIIDEQQPRWLTFLQGKADLIERVPAEFIATAMPNGRVAPNLAKQGIQGYRVVNSVIQVTLFNMENAVIGGYTPEKVALRRAIALGIDLDREIRLVRRGQAIPAQSPIMPNTTGYDPAFRSENSQYDPARARALLDLYGYVDRNNDGWREMPDGSELVLEVSTQADQLSRQHDELWQKNMAAIGVRVRFLTGQWPEQLRNARAGKLMVWMVGSQAAAPDGQGSLQRYHSKQINGQNLARFHLPAFDAIYERMEGMPDGPERLALFDQAKRLAVAYMPYKSHVHTYSNDMAHPWVIGYRRPVFWQEWWHHVDIDLSKLPA